MGVATQQILLGSSLSAPERTYVDDVFSTLIFEGNNTYPRTVTNGINFSEEGGLLIGKSRLNSYGWVVWDTLRGAGDKALRIDNNGGENNSSVGPFVKLDQFNSDGFRLGQPTSQDVFNASGENGVFWSFRKTPGFLDVKQFTWSNSNSTQSISHDLGSVPGLVILKASNSQNDWRVYHRDLGTGDDAMLALNQNYAAHGFNTGSNNNHFVSVTDTAVTVKSLTGTVSYIMYIFAGGASDEPGSARSVDFDGNDYLSIPVNNSDFDWAADGSLTIEAFVNMDAINNQSYNSIINRWGGSGTYSFGLDIKNNGNLFFYRGNGSSISTHESSGITIGLNQWYHIAVVKDGTTGRFFINGQTCGTFSWNEAFTNSTNIPLHLGNLSDGNSYPIDGRISNARIVNGTAVYTSAFKPPTQGLTNITNTKLLCCNKNTVTGSTVTTGTITSNGNPQSVTDTPFDDPAGFVFGDSGTENIIKCGSYRGDPSTHSNPTEVNVGFEPQWVLIKSTSSSANWVVVDSMRKWTGDTSDGAQNVEWLEPNTSDNGSNGSMLTLTSTGFIARQSSYTAGNNTFVYMAIRRNDGYVGKPADAGTDVFTAVYDTSGVPMFKTPNHDVDFTFQKDWNIVKDWNVSARLMEGRRLETNTPNAEEWNSYQMGDYSRGWSSYTGGDGSRLSYSFKRHPGMDVVVYKGTGTNLSVNHSLNGVPEFMWCKERDNAGTEWKVHHKDRGPSNILRLNNALAEETNQSQYQNTSPTATQFFVTSSLSTSNAHYLAVLFRSIGGISKVGSYIGTDADINLSFGFTPRLFIVKMADGVGSWHVFDTTRGITSNGAPRLELNTDSAQNTSAHYVEPYTNGIKIVESGAPLTDNGKTYIYYAHA